MPVPRFPPRRPTVQLVRANCTKYGLDQDLTLVDTTLSKLVAEFPRNSDLGEVLMKVTCINKWYSTEIRAVLAKARQIVRLKVDEYLDDPAAAVTRIAEPAAPKHPRTYSFATKYVAFHRPLDCWIFDGEVEHMLQWYAGTREYGFDYAGDLRDYIQFAKVMEMFRSHFGLDQFERRQIDKFLWIEARRNYLCADCAPSLLNQWRGWPHKDRVPDLPLLSRGKCPKCHGGRPLGIDRVSWMNVHSEFNTGLPDYWELRTDQPTPWGFPYYAYGRCSECFTRCVISEFGTRNPERAYNCPNCGVIKRLDDC